MFTLQIYRESTRDALIETNQKQTNQITLSNAKPNLAIECPKI